MSRELTRAQRDHETIRGKLDHHDREIHQLGNRIEKVEVGVNVLTSKMDEGFRSLNDGRGEVLSKLSRLDGHISKVEHKQGPGFFDQARMVATVGAVAGMIVTGITFLVNSFVSPSVTRLETNHTRVEQSVARREQAEYAELHELRKKDKERTEEALAALKTAIDDLKVKVGWTKLEIRR